MSSGGCAEKKEEPSQKKGGCCGDSGRPDFLLWMSLGLVVLAFVIHVFSGESVLSDFWPPLAEFTHGIYDLMARMWWGILAGILAVGVLHQIPREAVLKVMGRSGSATGIFRAMVGGLLLDLCNHGILLVGMKLYERGASLGQLFAFLIASPWNSFSLTLILISLIGLPWTLGFIAASALIAFATGMLVERFFRGVHEEAASEEPDPPGWGVIWKGLRDDFPRGWAGARRVLSDGWGEARMILRWVFFGVVLAAAIRAFFDPQTFQEWFGPSVTGLLLTLGAATIIEVCSEGSTPIGADLVNRAAAPGNGFAFLMAGAATDYTEIMALRETTGQWTRALLLPALTVPQVLVIGYLMNHAGGG